MSQRENGEREKGENDSKAKKEEEEEDIMAQTLALGTFPSLLCPFHFFSVIIHFDMCRPSSSPTKPLSSSVSRLV